MPRLKITDLKNGMARPLDGTIYRRVWDISDKVLSTKPERLRKAVLEACAKEGIGYRTASVAHCRWRTYRGIFGWKVK